MTELEKSKHRFWEEIAERLDTGIVPGRDEMRAVERQAILMVSAMLEERGGIGEAVAVLELLGVRR